MKLKPFIRQAAEFGIGLSILATLVLAGCGGGGSSTTGEAPKAAVRISGVVAKGLPLAGATVTIRDVNGKTTSALTAASGTYAADISGMTAPYLIQVPVTGGGTLYSVATSAGTINVHPFTDLIIRNWYVVKGTTVDTAFATSGSLPNPPSATDIDTIQAVVNQVISTYMKGANVPATFNLLTTPFDANQSGFDLVLDNLTVALPANSSGNVTISLVGGGSGNVLSVPAATDLTTITPPPAPVSDSVAPGTPGAISASRTAANQIVLSWGAATDNIGVAGYKIFLNGTQVGITDQPFYIDGAAPASSACYTVAAYDAAGNSSSQNTQVCASSTTVAADVTPPTAPGSLTAAAASSSQVNLTWISSTDNVAVAGYRVVVGGMAIATLPASATSYSHTGLNQQTQYSYTIVAFDTSGNATSSTTASATTPANADTTAPSVPTGITAPTITSSQIDLSWTASTDNVGVTGYRVYSGATLLGTTATPSFSVPNLSAATQYCVTITAFDAAGNVSAASAQACATTASGSSAPANVATSLLAALNTGLYQNNLTFNAASGTPSASTLTSAYVSKIVGSGTTLSAMTINFTTYAPSVGAWTALSGANGGMQSWIMTPLTSGGWYAQNNASGTQQVSLTDNGDGTWTDLNITTGEKLIEIPQLVTLDGNQFAYCSPNCPAGAVFPTGSTKYVFANAVAQVPSYWLSSGYIDASGVAVTNTVTDAAGVALQALPALGATFCADDHVFRPIVGALAGANNYDVIHTGITGVVGCTATNIAAAAAQQTFTNGTVMIVNDPTGNATVPNVWRITVVTPAAGQAASIMAWLPDWIFGSVGGVVYHGGYNPVTGVPVANSSGNGMINKTAADAIAISLGATALP